MKNFGIVSYNIHCNFTNYGSALQSWALKESINRIDNGKFHAKLIDYCPDILKDADQLNPIKNMLDKDDESRKLCELSLPAIRENFYKFEDFYTKKFDRTPKVYNSENFNEVVKDEKLDGFVCGSDTIFFIDEFGFDDGYYANFDSMKSGYTFSYAASFGDSKFDEETYKVLNERLKNFKAISIREKGMLQYVKDHTNVEVEKVLDPTLLLNKEDYDTICYPERLEKEKYLLLYSRRRNDKMTAYADKLAKENGWKVIDISLQASNADRHRMFYEAGVEEFLSLVKNAEFVVTNSFHGMIFSVLYNKEFVIFSRQQSNTKIVELIDLFGLKDRILVNGDEKYRQKIDYKEVFSRIQPEREKSLEFLKKNLEKCEE